MRKALGIVAFVLGVAGLCWYGTEHDAKRIQETVAEGATAASAGSAHGVLTSVSGRDIEVRGLADGAAERDAILKNLDAVAGRRVVRDRMDVLPPASPFTLSAEKLEGGLSASGNVPTEVARAALAGLVGGIAGKLTLASGAPEGWLEAARAGLTGLRGLETGSLTLSDKTLTLSGVAKTPAAGAAVVQAIEESLPPGYTLKSSLASAGDGKPPRFQVDYSAGDGASVSGTLPAGLTPETIAAALGLGEVSGEPKTGSSGEPGPVLAALRKLAGWLPELETLALRSGGDGEDESGGQELAVTAPPGADLELLERGLARDLGEDMSISVAGASDLPAEGTQRVNAATGETEVMTAGYWLPRMDFTAGYGQCRDKANALLGERRVNFVTGSARLDARSLRSINAITALVLNCVRSGDLKLEVGGHTDNQGDSAFNKQLSQQRAGAVVAALVARGVPKGSIVAAGYGDTQPVADNSTEAGRAANRRVSLVFSQ